MIVRAGIGIRLANCDVGDTYADLTFNGTGFVVDDSIATRQANKSGAPRVTSYNTCNGLFVYSSHPSAPKPITEAACLKSSQGVAYVDVIDRNSTRAIVNLIFWKGR
jgi:hypothetical protein